MAVKFSGAYKQCKPCTGSPSYKHGHGTYHPDIDTVSEGVPYPYIGSSASTPAWDFTGGGPRFTTASRADTAVDDESKEWVAQVEPGVHITFMSLSNGGNDLKRIRFSREMFNKWEAQRWWGENYERVTELYNVQRFNRQALQTPMRSEATAADEQRDSTFSRDSPRATWTPAAHYRGGGGYTAGPSGLRNESGYDAARTTTASSCCRDEPSVCASNASETESEWIEEDEPGVYITIRQLVDGTRELRRVRFRYFILFLYFSIKRG